MLIFIIVHYQISLFVCTHPSVYFWMMYSTNMHFCDEKVLSFPTASYMGMGKVRGIYMQPLQIDKPPLWLGFPHYVILCWKFFVCCWDMSTK